MGEKSQRVGARWEDDVKEECDKARKRRLADVERRKPPMKIVGVQRPGVFTCVHDKRRTVDFEGVLAGGRSIRFDAKRTSNDSRFSFGSIRDEQLKHLTDGASMGALAFLYVLCEPKGGSRRHRYILPVSDEGWIAGVAHKRSQEFFEVRTRESVRWDQIDPVFQVGPNETWADALVRLMALGAFGGRQEAA